MEQLANANSNSTTNLEENQKPFCHVSMAIDGNKLCQKGKKKDVKEVRTKGQKLQIFCKRRGGWKGDCLEPLHDKIIKHTGHTILDSRHQSLQFVNTLSGKETGARRSHAALVASRQAVSYRKFSKMKRIEKQKNKKSSVICSMMLRGDWVRCAIVQCTQIFRC